jgi:hypothetical protein
VECKVYHDFLINAKYQDDFDFSGQLHSLDMMETQEEKDIYWECCKVVNFCKEIGDDNGANQTCLVEWNNINKTKTRMKYFALSLNDPKTVISFASNNNLLDKMSFCHLTQIRRSNTAVDIARIHKFSTSPTGINKFGIQLNQIRRT